MTFTEFLNFQLYKLNSTPITIKDFMIFIGVLFVTHVLFLSISRFFLKPLFRRKQTDKGRQYAALQLVKYVVYTLGLLSAFPIMGVQLSILWAGSAALLVGVGLGLQQTFNDLVSGIILLIEGTVQVGDIVQIGDLVATVKEIGLRTSKVQTRDSVVIIIPNSKLVVDSVTNWSHNETYNRFSIGVGVSYTSDAQKVKRALLASVTNHPKILEIPAPSVQFIDFGDSSLNFKVFYFSKEYLGAEFVKSDVRFAILENFRKEKIEIPFPQRDLWIKNPVALSPQNLKKED